MSTTTISASPDIGLEGTYANLATRFIAFVLDVVVIAGAFALGSVVVERILGLFIGHTVTFSDAETLYRLSLVAWVFLYSAYPIAVAGRTLGMAVVGLRVLHADGTVLSGGRSVIRVAVLPLSFALFGLGFL